EPPKKSRKWRFKKVKKIGPHSSKYQKDYQKYTHEPVKTHRYTSTQHIQNTHTAVQSNTATYTYVYIGAQQTHIYAGMAYRSNQGNSVGHGYARWAQRIGPEPNQPCGPCFKWYMQSACRATATDFEP
mgnify:CR=1